MAKSGRMQQAVTRVLAVLLVASLALAVVSSVALAEYRWVSVCWYHHSYVNCQYFPCGYTWYHHDVYHVYRCWDDNGVLINCYDTGQQCRDVFTGWSSCHSYCP